MSTENTETDFVCPICGNKKYTPISIITPSTQIGGHVSVSEYKCDGCSVIFANPTKFTLTSRR